MESVIGTVIAVAILAVMVAPDVGRVLNRARDRRTVDNYRNDVAREQHRRVRAWARRRRQAGLRSRKVA